MKGTVTEQGQSLIEIEVRASAVTVGKVVSAWVDTAFNGDLVLPTKTIEELGLSKCAEIGAGLADGVVRSLDAFRAWIPWFGEIREVEVVGSPGRTALLGVGLMLGHDLSVSYRTFDVTLD